MQSSPDRANTRRGTADYLALREHQVVDYRGTAETMLPLAEASVVQLEPGPSPTNLEILSSDKASILGLHHHVASVGVVVLKPEYFGFMWWDGKADCRINGLPARRTRIYTQGEQDGFHAAGGARRTMGVIVRRNDLVKTLAALRGVGPEDVLLKRSALKLSPAAVTRFRSDVDALLAKTTSQGPDASANATTIDPAEAIFGLLVDAYLQSPPLLQKDDRLLQPEKIVRKAEERFLASQGAPVSLADLCAATGVSQSTLYRAFDAVCGEPPLAYFHKRRLTDARRALVRSTPNRGAVKRAALAAGLTEFGRFSVEYRQLFGESPSTTLGKSVPA